MYSKKFAGFLLIICMHPLIVFMVRSISMYIGTLETFVLASNKFRYVVSLEHVFYG